MKILGQVILLFTLQLSGYAQTDPQASVIVFYTTETAGRVGNPVVYSNGQKIGEVAKGRLTRLNVEPGTYQFALAENAPVAQQLSVSIARGQEVFRRESRTAFFHGNADEATASVTQNYKPQSNPANTSSTVWLAAAPSSTALVKPAVPTPEPPLQPGQKSQP